MTILQPMTMFLCMKDKAVVFFSRNGSTRIAANIISGKIDAELVELKAQKARHGFVVSGFRAVTKKHLLPEDDPWARIRECSTVVLGAPIWGGNANPVMNGFLDRADFTGKKVYLFTLQADTGKSKSDEVLAHYSQRVKDAGGTVAGSFALTGASPGKTADEGALREALAGWDLLK